jgi:hypothetical protein
MDQTLKLAGDAGLTKDQGEAATGGIMSLKTGMQGRLYSQFFGRKEQVSKAKRSRKRVRSPLFP